MPNVSGANFMSSDIKCVWPWIDHIVQQVAHLKTNIMCLALTLGTQFWLQTGKCPIECSAGCWKQEEVSVGEPWERFDESVSSLRWAFNQTLPQTHARREGEPWRTHGDWFMTAEGEESSRSAARIGPMPPASRLLSQCLQPYSHIIHRDSLEVNAPPSSPCASTEYCL